MVNKNTINDQQPLKLRVAIESVLPETVKVSETNNFCDITIIPTEGGNLNKAPASTHLEIASKGGDNQIFEAEDFQADDNNKPSKFNAQMSDSIQDMAEAPHITDDYPEASDKYENEFS